MRVCVCVLVASSALLFAGCSKSGDESSEAVDDTSNTTASGGRKLEVTAISSRQDAGEDGPAPTEGSAEWALQEIRKLRATPIPKDTSKLAETRRKRNERIVSLATKAISETHQDKKQEKSFNEAVHQLLEARLELALQGRQEDVEALYEDVQILDRRDHNSRAAIDAAYTLARFSHTNARRYASSQPQWLAEFSRQARLFADNYPKEVARAAPLLFAAGRSCELHSSKMLDDGQRESLLNEAKLCFTGLKAQFPETHQGRRAFSVLRRLALPGQQLTQFAGPTLDGQYVSIDKLSGRVVVIVFWSSENTDFVQGLSDLNAAIRRFQQAGVEFVTVNLDKEEDTVRGFLKNTPIPAKHIFFPEPEQRRWDSPIVTYWGVMDIPAVWLVDRQGVVQSTTTSLDELDGALDYLVRQAP